MIMNNHFADQHQEYGSVVDKIMEMMPLVRCIVITIIAEVIRMLVSFNMLLCIIQILLSI